MSLPTVHLTSFRHYMELPGMAAPWSSGMQPYRAFSVAVYQPEWYPELPKLEVFDIRDEAQDGAWVRPRNFIDEGHDASFPAREMLQQYHDHLVRMYTYRLESGSHSLAELYDEELWDVVLCCWCPNDRAAKRQLDAFGSFVCHTWPIETVLTDLGFRVERDRDREKMVR